MESTRVLSRAASLVDGTTWQIGSNMQQDLCARIEALSTVLVVEGAIAVPFLNHSECTALIKWLDQLPYRPAQQVTGSSKYPVFQGFELCYDIPSMHPLWRLAGDLGRVLHQALSNKVLLASPMTFTFNDVIVQRYPPGCSGISPHRDHLRYAVVIAILVLSGDGQFCTCEDRVGRGAREIPAVAGDLLLMSAPGLRGIDHRPLHRLGEVTRLRRTVGMRYDLEKNIPPA